MQKKHWMWGNEMHDSTREEKTLTDEFTRMAYATAWQAAREKRMELSENLETEKLSQEILPYDVHRYISKICWLLRDLIAELSEIGREFMSVSFYYRLETGEAAKWQRITETGNGLSEDTEKLSKYCSKLCEQFLNEGKPYIYILDKRRGIRCGKYSPNQRDAMFDYEGSVIFMKMDFENGGRKYVQGIMEISVYGKVFIDVDNCCRKQGRCFEYVMAYDILPYFRQLFQTEIGMLYMDEMRMREMEGR